jgi:Glycosyltransferase WbsX
MEFTENVKETTQPANNQRPKLIAMYFPQLHAIPENDEWWGEGFTDWNNVKTAKPQFDGHYQPRTPLGENYYDQSKLETIRWQVDIAKTHGLYGFCHYHYWFDGKQLLETPTNLMLENKDIDFPFCLSWANETWSRRWDAQDHQILIKQTHPPTKESWKKHYDYLIKAWKDPRAIKVDGKPVFIIYRPQRIEKINDMLAYWRELALLDGLPGLYFIFQMQYELQREVWLEALASFDAIFQFQPFQIIYSPAYFKVPTLYKAFSALPNDKQAIYRKLKANFKKVFADIFSNPAIRNSYAFKVYNQLAEIIQNQWHSFRRSYVKSLTIHDYDTIWKHIVEIKTDAKLPIFPGAFVDWDNSARYKKRATLFKGATPQRFEKWFSALVKTMPQRNLPENFIFLNAWNEWSEGTYLEPDEKFGCQYIEAVKRVLG